MILAEVLNNNNTAVSVVKTVWQKRGAKISRKEASRLLATTATKVDPQPRSEQQDISDGK